MSVVGTSRWGTGARYTAVVVSVVIVMFPIYAAVVAALTRYENLGRRLIVPNDWAWSNFVEVWNRIPLATYMRATFIYAAGASLCCLVLASLAGYALSRFRFAGRRVYLYALLTTQVIPLIVVMVPLFSLIKGLGLYDTYLAIIIATTGVSLPFPIMFLKSYFDGIPVELEEAARVDGCSRLQALARVVLPSATPALLTTFSLVFFLSWQMFLLPLVLANSDDKVPVTVGIFRLLSDYYTPWQYIMAASLIASLPAIAVFIAAQKYLIGGLTAGAVK